MSFFVRNLMAVVLFSCLATLVRAQEIPFQRRVARPNELPPRALLIKINTQQKRLEYAARIKDEQLADQVKKDASEATRRMIMDFTENFDYCPVYYFYDTSAPLILAGDFTHALLNKDLQPAQDIQLHPGDTNFFVGYFGLLVPDTTVTHTERKTTDAQSADHRSPNSEDYYGKKSDENYKRHADLIVAANNWIILDYRLRNVRAPIPWTYYRAVDLGERKSRRRYKDYKFKSKRFNIEYKPVAMKYNATLYWFYRIFPRY